MTDILNAPSQNTMLPIKSRYGAAGVQTMSIGPGGETSRATGRETRTGGYESWAGASSRTPDIYVVPIPKCFILRANGTTTSTTFNSINLIQVPPAYTSVGRTSSVISASRLNLNIRVQHFEHDVQNSAQWRFVLLLCVNGFNHPTSTIFVNPAVWGTPINPSMLSTGNYVVLADQVVELECVPGQFAPTSANLKMLDNNRFVSLSRDLQNIPVMYNTSTATSAPMKNNIVLFHQCSANLGSGNHAFSYDSRLHFYDV